MRINYNCLAIVMAVALATAPLTVNGASDSRSTVMSAILKESVMEIDGKTVPVVKRTKTSESKGKALASKRSRLISKVAATTRTLINEDFSGFKAGSPENPDTENIAYEGDISAEYTVDPGWNGNLVRQAGGMCYLEDPTRYFGAVLNTPLGDYSGDITIRCRVKGVENNPSHRFVISVLKGGYENPREALTENGEKIAPELVVVSKYWTDVEFKVANYSADADGFIQFSAYEKLLLDDIEIITDDTNFIAPPHVIRPEKFQTDGFTISWDPVDWASAYNILLYQKEYTSENERTFTADFEDGLNEGFEVDGDLLIQEYDGSNALWLTQGQKIYTPYNFSKYRNFTCRAKLVNLSDDAEGLEYAQIQIGVRDSSGWRDYGTLYADNYIEDGMGTIDLNFQTEDLFGDRYYGVYLYVWGVSEGTYLVLDDIEIPAGRDAELKPSKDGYEYGMYYAQLNYGDVYGPTEYTFTGLDMDKEYWYVVQSQNKHHLLTPDGNKPSDSIMHHAFGLTEAVALPASEISSDKASYVANWEPLNKATSYRVDNYGIIKSDSETEMTLVNEDFSKIDDNCTDAQMPDFEDFTYVDFEDFADWDDLENYYTDICLDRYMQDPGWTGFQNGIAQGWIALLPTGSPGQLQSPYLDLSHDTKTYVDIQALSYPSEYLYIYTPDGEMFYADFDENGRIDGRIELPISGSDLRLRFNVYNLAFIKNIRISQDVKTGDEIRFWRNEYIASPEETSHEFIELDLERWPDYGYTMRGIRDEVEEYFITEPSNFILASFAGKASKIDGVTGEKYIVGYYSIDGIRHDRPMQGVNIIRYSDGSTRKLISK